MPLIVRRFLPHIIVVTMLVVALVAAGFGITMGISRRSTNDPAPVVLHYANENVSDLLSLDPANGEDLNAKQAAQIIFGGLVRFGPGFTILPDAARSWTIGDQGRTYTFYLRPGVRFGDGTPLTAQDVAFSLNRTLSPQFTHQSGAFLLDEIAGATSVSDGKVPSASGIQVVNAHTLRLRLVAPTPTFLKKLATSAGYIVPPNAVRKDPQHWDHHAFGTGPYMVARWIPNKGLLLVANPYYWGGKLRIESIDMPFVPEPLAAYKLYSSGAIDAMGTIHFPAAALADAQRQPDFHRSPRLETVFLWLNERKTPFDNTKVRLAFSHAVNRAAVVHQAYGDLANPTDQMLPPGLPGYRPVRGGGEYNPQLARRLLAEAGFPGGRGLPSITYAVDQGAENLALASAVATQWRQTLGIRVKVVQYGHSDYLTLLDKLNYQVAAVDWTADYPDPENFLTQQLETGSPNNNGRWSDRTFDRLVRQAADLPTESPARLARYYRAQAIAMNQAATIPLANPSAGILLRQTIHGLTIQGGQLLARDWSKVTISRGSGL